MIWLHQKLQSKNRLCSTFRAAESFVHGNSEGVSYSRHFSSTQLSVEFIVPLWKTAPKKIKKER